MGRGILGTRAGLVADINLILQVAAFILLYFGGYQALRGKLDAFRRLLAAAVVGNAVSIIAIMNPAFFRVFPFAWQNPTAPGPAIIWPHVITGALAELMALYIVAAIRPGVEGRVLSRADKAVIVATYALWLVALALGIARYFIRYG